MHGLVVDNLCALKPLNTDERICHINGSACQSVISYTYKLKAGLVGYARMGMFLRKAF